jgi:hypothetical protein
VGAARICPFCRAQFLPDTESGRAEQEYFGEPCARCGLGDQVVRYGEHRATQKKVAGNSLKRLESCVPQALDGDPVPSEFGSHKSELGDAMACERCNCLTYNGSEIQPEEVCEKIYGSFGMLRIYEQRAIGVTLKNATFGNVVFRKQAQCTSRHLAGGNFNTLVTRTPFERELGLIFRQVKIYGNTSVWIACGQTGSKLQAKGLGKFRQATWWLTTTTLVSAMFNSDSESALYSLISSADYANSAMDKSEISSSYHKKFEEFSHLLDETIN